MSGELCFNNREDPQVNKVTLGKGDPKGHTGWMQKNRTDETLPILHREATKMVLTASCEGTLNHG